MSKATNEITSQFKNTFVRTSGRSTTEVLKAYRMMGFKNTDRVEDQGTTYVRVDDAYDVWYDTYNATPAIHGWIDPQPTEVAYESIIEAAEQVRKIKREESKASKKRRAQRKWDATATKRTTEVCPVREDVVIAAKLVDGSVITERAGWFDWTTARRFKEKDIASYKVLTPNKHRKQNSVSVEEMVADIVESAGGTEVQHVDKDGFIAWNPDKDFNWTHGSPGWSGPVSEGTHVDIKLRSGEVVLNKASGSMSGPGAYPAGAFWANDNSENDIVAYRVCPAVTPAAPVTQAKQPDAFVEVPEVESVAMSEDIAVPVVGDVNSNERGSGARYNAGKPDFALIPMALLEGEARVWAYGAKKYKAWNWMKGMDWSVPFACAMRHMAAWQRGEDTDPETGESHLDHAMCNLRMLRYYADFYKEGDNRPKEFFSLAVGAQGGSE